MTEIRVEVDDEWFSDLRSQIGGRPKSTEIVRDALSFYKWVLEQRKAGRYIISVDDQGKDPHRIVVPSTEGSIKSVT